jgi:hypothetical protein
MSPPGLDSKKEVAPLSQVISVVTVPPAGILVKVFGGGGKSW